MIMKRTILITAALLALSSCGWLEPLDTERVYSDENLSDYPSFIRGFLETALSKLPSDYESVEYLWLDSMTGDLLFSSESNSCRMFSKGLASPGNGVFDTYWTRDYSAILYLNKFLADDLGYNTRYLTDGRQNERLVRDLKGDAFALRAWFEYDLLLKFGGKVSDGSMQGFPIVTDIVDYGSLDADSFSRDSYDDCVDQILRDCDSALVYLPVANRDWLVSDTQYEGSIRWRRPDALVANSIKALTYLLWASPAFNPSGDKSRWNKAAENAAKVLDFKMTEDAAHGFDITADVNWFTQQSPEAVWCNAARTTNTETNMYPFGFLGNGTVGPTQNIVDAFPMANGYPIDRAESCYNPSKPYEGRDARFYKYINFDGARVIRPSNDQTMYTFECYTGGKDEAGKVRNTKTGYYVKKFVYQGWNGYDDKIETQQKALMLIRFREMCLVYAEAANKAVGPKVELFGHTAAEILGIVRGLDKDPYLDECAAGEQAFDSLVRNERRVELYLEGKRFYDMRRWADTELNVDVYAADITLGGDGCKTYGKKFIEKLNFPSPWVPVPRNDVRKSGLEQNKGWEDWK